MKGIQKLLALALVLLMLLLPAAVAEETGSVEAWRLTLSDPVVTMNGAELANLEGVSLEGTLAAGEDVQTLILRLLGGEEVAAEGYASFDGRQVLLGADGLSNVFVLPLERMLGAGSMEAFDALGNLFSEETADGVLDVYMDFLVSYYEALAQTRVDLGTQTIEFSTGPMEAQGYSYTITAEMLEEYIADLEGALFEIPAFQQALDGAQVSADIRPDGYNEEKDGQPADEVAFGDMTLTYWIVGDASAPEAMRMEETMDGVQPISYTGEYILQEDGSYAVECEMEMTYAGRESIIMQLEGVMDWGYGITFALLHPDNAEAMLENMFDLSGTMMDVTITMDMGEEGYAEGDIALYPQGYTEDNAEMSTLQANINMNIGGENVFFILDGYSWPADGVEYDYDEVYGMMQFGTAEENQTIELILQDQHQDGYEYYAARLDVSSGQTGTQSLYYTYEGDYAVNEFGDEDHTGLLALGFGMSLGGVNANYEAALNVGIAHETMDAAQLPAIEGETVDIRMIDEKVEEQLSTESQVMLMRATSILLQNAPGLLELMSELGAF